MASKEILTSKLLEPGTKFIVTDAVKDNSLLPGSLGFVSFTRGIDESYQDIGQTSVVIIRTGKTGKPRIMTTTICTPVFYVDHEGFDRLLPSPGTKKYYMHIERDLLLATDIRRLTPLEFLGYSVAVSKQIKHMSDQCQHKKWPEAKSHPINVLKRMPEYFEDDSDALLEKYSAEEFRDNFITEARRMLSSLIRVQIQLDLNRADVEVNAAEFLLFANRGEFIPKDAEDKTNEYEFTDDNAMLKRTIKYHQELRANIQTLFENKRKKKK